MAAPGVMMTTACSDSSPRSVSASIAVGNTTSIPTDLCYNLSHYRVLTVPVARPAALLFELLRLRLALLLRLVQSFSPKKTAAID